MAVGNTGATDANVRVADDGTGKRIRNLKATILQDDGSLVDVYMQVVALTDENGDVLTFSRLEGLMEQILTKLTEMHEFNVLMEGE